MTARRDVPLTWRPPKALRDRIEALATERGVALSKVLQDLVERGLLVTDGTRLASAPRKQGGEAKPGRKRTDYCVHRRKPDEFCPRCDR